ESIINLNVRCRLESMNALDHLEDFDHVFDIVVYVVLSLRILSNFLPILRKDNFHAWPVSGGYVDGDHKVPKLSKILLPLTCVLLLTFIFNRSGISSFSRFISVFPLSFNLVDTHLECPHKLMFKCSPIATYSISMQWIHVITCIVYISICDVWQPKLFVLNT
ncbi:hypothetical protein L9F63_019402, partial [Diploptera punctata]